MVDTVIANNSGGGQVSAGSASGDSAIGASVAGGTTAKAAPTPKSIILPGTTAPAPLMLRHSLFGCQPFPKTIPGSTLASLSPRGRPAPGAN